MPQAKGLFICHSSGWSANDGLLLRVNTATARAATYTGTVTWTLGSTVANQ
ncbi:hypothetical protein [Lactiplantibacillus paraplantarum]|uniref:hypothetical protein n=1 Tax=Lactiplantibacillus paraplantarum TaxID=60520 RepID=UPI0003ADBAC8|nr:hypothetical protein [Lactiplantibacillus paraplantarum]ERL42815.1 hypothetical protein N644_3089 [Lactiplantibacillus paraplantarum]KRL49830.1 hypothetical protein FD48_GL003079 [Lactiplantibacillus paraplantarum DSM 10667]MCU4684372.1 hypothetical protein [Lactiplantibacillus paraplantarum]WEE35158.1 hypothetical protein PWO93_10700 [Lactiplantibacillus paraplantarum]GEO61455.1 hypothetical protein LPA07_17760 [Lactiplantibacillus paraplantarum]